MATFQEAMGTLIILMVAAGWVIGQFAKHHPEESKGLAKLIFEKLFK